MNLSPGLALLFLLTPLLGGCFQTVTGSVAGSECKIFTSPQYAVRGARPYDQDWIDSTVEGGVGGCHWKRPASRPAELDTVTSRPAAPVLVKKKPGLFKRIKEKAWPSKAVTPVTQIPVTPVAPVTPPPPAAPRAAIDELLHPSVVK